MSEQKDWQQDRDNQSFYKEMVESAFDGMLLLQDNIIINCNQAACDLYGLTREQLCGCHPGQLSPEIQPDGESSQQKANRLMSAALDGEARQFLWQHLRHDGAAFTAQISLNPARTVEIPGEGRKSRFVAILRDVTAEQSSSLALQQSELRFRQLFEQAPVALALTRGEEVHVINQRWQNLFGYNADEIRTLEDWWTRAYPDMDYRSYGRKAWEDSLNYMRNHNGVIPSAEYKVRCGDGCERYVLIGGAQVGDEVMVSFYDMTAQHLAQKALAELNNELERRVEERTAELKETVEYLQRAQEDLVRSEKLASLGALVAGIAHELNTPIGNAVMVGSSLQQMERDLTRALEQGLKRSVLERFLSEVRESVDIMARNLRRAAELITSFKQVAVDQSSYQRREFNLAEVVHELRLTLSPTLKKSQVTLSEDIPIAVIMDSYPGPLTQVLMNIVNNAVMHAFEGIDQREVSISATQTSAEEVTLIISDNGCGIDPAHKARLFDPFFTTKLGKGGSGLGLHIVYSLVTELLGGNIAIDSDPGAGTRATLTIPLCAPSRDDANSPGADQRNSK